MVIIEWSIIEPNVGIVCACIPVIHRPLATLFVKAWPKGKNTRSTPYTQPSGQDSGTAPISNANHWLPLEPFDASAAPKSITNVLGRPLDHPQDDVESLNRSAYIKKTTDISVHYDHPSPTLNI